MRRRRRGYRPESGRPPVGPAGTTKRPVMIRKLSWLCPHRKRGAHGIRQLSRLEEIRMQLPLPDEMRLVAVVRRLGVVAGPKHRNADRSDSLPELHQEGMTGAAQRPA